MRTRENAIMAVLGGTLVLALTIAGLLVMESFGGFAGSLILGAFAVLWVMFGVTIAFDFYRGARRRR